MSDHAPECECGPCWEEEIAERMRDQYMIVEGRSLALTVTVAELQEGDQLADGVIVTDVIDEGDPDRILVGLNNGEPGRMARNHTLRIRR